MVVARTTAGEIAFLTGHVPFVGVLSGKSPVKIAMAEGPVRVVAVHSGFVEVSHDNVTILSDVAELAEEVDVARAQSARRCKPRNSCARHADDARRAGCVAASATCVSAVATATTPAAH